MKTDMISVIIPSYRGSDCLGRAVESVLSQTYENIEVIVVDDNDPGDEHRKATEMVMQRYSNNQKVIYVKNDKNCERSCSRNRGSNYAQGEYLMFLDDDDEFLPQKAESQFKCLKDKGKEYAVSYSSYIRRKNGKTICKCAEFREGNLVLDALARNLFIHAGSNLMIRKEVFFELGGFNETLSYNEDIDLVARIMVKYKIAYCDVLGLVVNIKKGERNKKRKDLKNITDVFVSCEMEIINKFTKEERIRLNKYLGLQLVRFYFPKEIKKMFAIVQEYKIDTFLLIRYFLYLIKRGISKKAYGFIIK